MKISKSDSFYWNVNKNIWKMVVLIDLVMQIEAKCLLCKYMNPLVKKIKSYDWFDHQVVVVMLDIRLV
jgi:hypothetical protein